MKKEDYIFIVKPHVLLQSDEYFGRWNNEFTLLQKYVK